MVMPRHHEPRLQGFKDIANDEPDDERISLVTLAGHPTLWSLVIAQSFRHLMADQDVHWLITSFLDQDCCQVPIDTLLGPPNFFAGLRFVPESRTFITAIGASQGSYAQWHRS